MKKSLNLLNFCFGMKKRKNRDVWLFPDQMKQSSHNYFIYLPANSKSTISDSNGTIVKSTAKLSTITSLL